MVILDKLDNHVQNYVYGGIYTMAVWKIVLIVVLVVLAALFIALLIIGNKMRKRQEEQQAQIDAAKQVMSMLIIDKKIMKMSEAGLPKIVMDQTPKYMRRTKLPIVKAKIGPKVMTLIADNKVFDELPVKAEVKAEVSGIYIVGLKSVRGGKAAPAPAKKKGFMAKLRAKAQKTLDEDKARRAAEEKSSKKNKKK
ncbi:hypothetical protein BACPEC_01714 [[Bacteroides] pectinophilus ATCC 43243]|jgi:hypothetical protein|uniref:Uncharacterized protein n=1 Tax=[Bacteroides] pectinophilus ATCC 43243 TaxID=483218 RepID=B7ARL0_9FIRM|nr:hypothetical protein BACPEC_01714 [[Bacteroides] pectinophilus ATCC 43243]